MPIQYKTGDATRPVGDDPKIICHVCNDIGAWGAGFVVALSKRWKLPEQRYRAWYAGDSDDGTFELGEVQFVAVESEVTVANMIGQRGIRRGSQGIPPIRYEAVRTALGKVAAFAVTNSASVHMPRIGAGLGGGDWNTVAALVEDELCGRAVSVTVYDLPKR